VQIVGVVARPNSNVRPSAGHSPDVHELAGRYQSRARLPLAVIKFRTFGCGHRGGQRSLGFDEEIHGASGYVRDASGRRDQFGAHPL